MKTETEVKSASSAKLDLRTAPGSSNKQQRNSALDFTKGTLVLLMVLYHWVNYFIGPQWAYYEYLRFLTPSFIFITGFLISNVYLSKYTADSPNLPRRLFTRGFKLLAIFVALNIARTVFIPVLGTHVVVQTLLDVSSVFTIFVSGNFPVVGAKLAVFPILLPIGYLLMLSAVLVIPYRRYRYTFHTAAALLLLSITVLAFTKIESAYLEMITLGMLGVLAGFVPIGKIEGLIWRPYALVLAYAFYTIAITVWNVPFPLLIFGVTLSLLAIYRMGISRKEPGAIRKQVILLGKYSLFGYISQIAILQVLSVGFRHVNLHAAVIVTSFLAAFTLTIASSDTLDYARVKAPSLDRIYKAVFA